jgi:c-di-AMP phosphodiesterase-like protein
MARHRHVIEEQVTLFVTSRADEFLVQVETSASFRTRNDHEFVTVLTDRSLGSVHVQCVRHTHDRNCDGLR